MKLYQMVQRDINEMTDAMEMAEFLDGLYVAANIYCITHCPEEVEVTDSGEHRISVTGFAKYLNRNVGKPCRINDPVLEAVYDLSTFEECKSQISQLYKRRTEEVSL